MWASQLVKAGTNLCLLDSTPITRFQNMLSLYPENTLITLIPPGPRSMLQF